MFLGEMSAVVPWVEIEAVIEQYFPKMGPEGGRRAFPLKHVSERSEARVADRLALIGAMNGRRGLDTEIEVRIFQVSH